MSQYFELLNSNVYDKKNIVTYRWLSRKLNVNVNQAKEILYEFKVNENDKIHCVYCISGQLKKDNELSIELIPEEKLEETKQKFQHCFIHIYSIEAQNLKELDPLISENYDIINNITDNPQDYSIVRCDYIHKKERQVESASIDDIPSIKPEPSIYNSSNNSLKDIKKEKNDFFKKTTSNKKNNKTKDAKSTFFDKFKKSSLFDIDNNSSDQKPIKKEPKNSMDMFLKDIHASTVKKENEIKEEKDDPMEISETKIIESPKPTDEEEKRRIIEEEKKNLEREKEIEEENERLKHLFDDDDLSTPINKPSGNKKIVINDDDDDDDDEDNEDNEDNENNNFNIISNEPEQKPKKLVKSDDPREKGRKRYRVVKQKTYIDDKGYLVTEDVSDWESASETEETIVQKPKQKSLFDMRNHNNKRSSYDERDNSDNKIKKRKSGQATEKTQKSILSFFGRH